MRILPLAVLFSLLCLNAYAQDTDERKLPGKVTTVRAGNQRIDVPALEQEHTGSHATPRNEGANRLSERENLPDGLRLGDEDRLEVFVDLEGNIYKRRLYQGVVPKLNDDAPFSESVQKHIQTQKGTKIMWVGFQQMLAASRVFIQTDRVVKYTLYKPTPTKIVVEFPGARVPLKNNQRELLTGSFQTPVEMVRVIEDKKSGTSRIVIHLKRPVGYIYRQDGPYVFVDIER